MSNNDVCRGNATPSEPVDEALVAQRCKALGHPVRVYILRYIAQHPGCIGIEILLHLPDGAPHAQSTLSQHLRILREAGLIIGSEDGSAVCYHTDHAVLGALASDLSRLT